MTRIEERLKLKAPDFGEWEQRAWKVWSCIREGESAKVRQWSDLSAKEQAAWVELVGFFGEVAASEW